MMQWCAAMPGWGGHWMGGLLVLLSWVLSTAGMVAIVRWFFLRFARGSAASQESPLEILKRRYAKGEIDKAEFEEKKKDLEV
jgi:putative membrane protein